MWFHAAQPLPKPSVQPAEVVESVDYPSGVAVRTTEAVYFIKGKCKYKICSFRAADSWCFDELPGTVESLSKFKLVGTLGFRDGTLIQNIADNKFYLISDAKRRHIIDPDVFNKFGFNIDDVVWASQTETNIHEEGEVLS